MPWKVTWPGSMFVVVYTGSAAADVAAPSGRSKEYQSRCPPGKLSASSSTELPSVLAASRPKAWSSSAGCQAAGASGGGSVKATERSAAKGSRTALTAGTATPAGNGGGAAWG